MTQAGALPLASVGAMMRPVPSRPLTLSGEVEDTTAVVLVAHVAAAATTQGSKVSAPVPGSLMLTRRFRPGWSVALGIGIIALALVLGSLGADPAVWVIVLVAALLIVFVKQSETVALVVTERAGVLI
jgi:hypothetical protein